MTMNDKKYNPFYWKSITAIDIQNGNIISEKQSTRPKLIKGISYDLENKDNIELICSIDGIGIFFKTVNRNSEFDVLMNKDTNEAATQSDLFEVSKNE